MLIQVGTVQIRDAVDGLTKYCVKLNLAVIKYSVDSSSKKGGIVAVWKSRHQSSASCFNLFPLRSSLTLAAEKS